MSALPSAPCCRGYGMASFVGAEQTLAGLERLVLGGERLVTVTGPPGVGKTRLACEVVKRQGIAGRFGAILWVCLHGAFTEQELVQAVSDALRLERDFRGEHGGRKIKDALVRAGETLLVLDNFERLPDAAAHRVATWLSAAPGASVLVTSRRRLRFYTERVFELLPLAIDPPPTAPAGTLGPAPQLFVDRARWRTHHAAVDRARDHSLIRSICQRLDGLPLAIELAAAWAEVLGLQRLRDRLDQSLAFLSHRAVDGDPRHLSLLAAVHSSWEQLTPDLASTLAQLGLFESDFDLDAAEAVVEAEVPVADLLAALVDHSLVQLARVGDAPRFLIHGAVREVALDALREVGGCVGARSRFERHYLQRFRWQPDRSLAVTEAVLDLPHVERALFGVLSSAPEVEPDLAEAALDVLLDAGPYCLVGRTSASHYRSLIAQAEQLPVEDSTYLGAGVAYLRASADFGLSAGSERALRDAREAAIHAGRLRLAARMGVSLAERVAARRPDEAAFLVQQSVAQLRAVGDVIANSLEMAWSAVSAVRRGELLHGAELFARVLREAREVLGHASVHLGWIAMNAALAHHAIGAHDTALELLEEGRGVFERLSHGHGRAIGLILAAALDIEAGRRTDGHGVTREAAALLAGFDPPESHLELVRWLAFFDLHYGDPADALAWAIRGLAEAPADADPVRRLLLETYAATALSIMRHRPQANLAWQRVAALAGSVPTREDVRLLTSFVHLDTLEDALSAGRRDEAVALWLPLLEASSGDSSAAPTELSIRAARRLLQRQLASREFVLQARGVFAAVIDRARRAIRPLGAPAIELGSTPRLWQLAIALFASRVTSPGSVVRDDELLQQIWIGEEMVADSGINRLRVAVSKLRKLGLEPFIERACGGYVVPDRVVVAITNDSADDAR